MHDVDSLPEGGFTLIEVLVALVVVSLGMLGAIEAVNQSITTSTYLRDKSMAQWVAMNKLTEARLQAAVPAVDKTSGDAEMAGQKYRWTLTVTKTPVPTMLRLDVTISPPEGDDTSSLASATGFYSASIARQSQALACQDPINGPGGGGPQTGNPGTQNPGNKNPGTQNPGTQSPPILPPSPNKEPE